MATTKKKSAHQQTTQLVVIATVVTVFGLTGYALYAGSFGSDKNSTDTSQSPVANDVAAAPTISTTDDLDRAIEVIDSTDIGSDKDLAELDSQLSAF